MTLRPTQRLTRDDWLTASAKVLALKGAEALKAEPMARHMKTTKGSFYWHFKDVPDFHTQILERWESAAMAAMQGVEETDSVPELRALAQAFAGPPQDHEAETAIRAWARAHDGAKETVARVDAARLKALQALLAEIGIGNPEMARIIYASAIGMAVLDDDGMDNQTAIGSLVDLVLALR